MSSSLRRSLAMAPRLTIEVCIDSLESAEAAIRGGADRLEVCGNLGIGGGTTPSIGLIKSLRKRFPEVPLMAMIRPRAGDFVYSDPELTIMMEDIEEFKRVGVHGVVLGLLESEGTLHVGKTKRLVVQASPMQVCFHRAFDMAKDLLEEFRILSTIPGITRVLTSGGGPSALGSLDNLAVLFSVAQSLPSAVSILPGSGINAGTISALLDTLLPLGLQEIHMSGGGWVEGEMAFRKKGMGMGVGGRGEWGVWRTKEEAVRTVRSIVDKKMSAYAQMVERC